MLFVLGCSCASCSAELFIKIYCIYHESVVTGIPSTASTSIPRLACISVSIFLAKVLFIKFMRFNVHSFCTMRFKNSIQREGTIKCLYLFCKQTININKKLISRIYHKRSLALIPVNYISVFFCFQYINISKL